MGERGGIAAAGKSKDLPRREEEQGMVGQCDKKECVPMKREREQGRAAIF